MWSNAALNITRLRHHTDIGCALHAEQKMTNGQHCNVTERNVEVIPRSIIATVYSEST